MKIDKNFIRTYLDLIQIGSIKSSSLESLAHLQSNHLETLAWNTLDVFLGRKVILDPNIILNKFISEKRGGLCYELNGAFCYLLNQLGFDAYLSTCFALNYHDDPFDFPSDTHAIIIVNFENDKYLVEVGFGDLIKNPVKIENQFHYQDKSGEYRLLLREEIKRFQLERLCDSGWKPQYHFEVTPRDLKSFTPNLEVVYRHPTYQKLNYIRPDKQGVQILKDDQYIVRKNQKIETYLFEELGGIKAILKGELGIAEQFVNEYFA